MYIVQRTQIYLDETAAGRLDERARAAGATRSQLIRDAIDRYLALDERTEAEVVRRQREALTRVFGRVPDIGETVARSRARDAERTAELDDRRRG